MLLGNNHYLRPSAEEALTHKWTQKFNQFDLDHQDATILAFANLQNFKPEKKLQEAVINFIVNQLATKEDTVDIKKVFNQLDINKNGELCREEIMAGFKMIYGECAEDHVNQVFDQVDIDNSGAIDIQEWICATIDKTKLLTPQKLKLAFRLFDVDGDGTITTEELKMRLYKNQDVSDDVWDAVIAQVDVDGDGEIDQEEFSTMMRMLISD